ncbi:MAG: TonB-dependent receptor [Steroidobacteraceae bacterium]
MTIRTPAAAADPDPQSVAQTAGGRGTSGVEQIVVTATRQATNVQRVPIAITAVKSDELEQRGITSVGDLTSVVPNAQFQQVQGAFGPGVSAYIRGIGSGDTSLGGESLVAFYIDDVYYPLLLDANFDLLDMDHIEVLRGPQGTLFGRNALAGAVNIVAKQPSLTSATGYTELTTGALNRRDIRAGFNLPLSDTVALMASAMSKRRDGYVQMLDFTCEMQARGTPGLAGSIPSPNTLLATSPNFTPGSCANGELGGQDVLGGRASLLWQAASSAKVTLTTDYVHDQSENTADTAVALNPALVNNNLRSEAAFFGTTLDNRFLTGNPYTTYAAYRDPITAGTVIPGNTYYNGLQVDGQPTRGGYAVPPHQDDINWGTSVKLVWDLGNNIDLTAIGSYRSLHDIHTYDTQALPLTVEMTENDITENYINSEVRLSGKSKLIDWVAGVFYFDGSGVQHATDNQIVFGGLHYLYTTYKPDTKAAFVNATVHPFDNGLSFVVGGRYSRDKKEVNFSNLLDLPNSPNDIRFSVEPHESKASWKAGVNYQMTDDVLFYTSAASGFSLPGYNARPLQPDQVAQFDGDSDVAYELGTKFEMLDHRAQIDANVFYTDFNNRPTAIGGAEPLLNADGTPVIGSQQLVPLAGGPAGSTACGTTAVPANTGIVCIGRTYYVNEPANVRGFEIEYTVNPFGNLVINGSTGYNKLWAPDIAKSLNRRQVTPFWTANTGVQYEFESDAIAGSVTPRLDWTYEDSQIVSTVSTAYNGLLSAHSIFNARVSYDNRPHDFSIALGATNLFDKFYWINVFDYQTLGYPETMAQPAPPREWYLTLTKRF